MASTQSISGVVIRTDSADSSRSNRHNRVHPLIVAHPSPVPPDASIEEVTAGAPTYSSDHDMVGRSAKVYFTTDTGSREPLKMADEMSAPPSPDFGVPMEQIGPSEPSDTLNRTLHQVCRLFIFYPAMTYSASGNSLLVTILSLLDLVW